MPTLLPPNATQLETTLEAVVATRLDALGTATTFNTAWNPTTCPLPVLPWLAWALSVDSWNPLLSEAERRAVVASSIAQHRRKGTVGSIKALLADLGYGTAILDEGTADATFNGGETFNGIYTFGNPTGWAEYTLTLDRPLTLAQANELKGWLAQVAPARCTLKALIFTQATLSFNGQQTYDGTYTHGTV